MRSSKQLNVGAKCLSHAEILASLVHLMSLSGMPCCVLPIIVFTWFTEYSTHQLPSSGRKLSFADMRDAKGKAPPYPRQEIMVSLVGTHHDNAPLRQLQK